jgi:hypothetical protein
MSRALFLYLLATAALSLRPTRARAEAPAPLVYSFSYASDELAKLQKPPYFRVFPGGLDKDGKDASSSLGTLKAARGESKLYKQEDVKAGLIVVLRRVLFVPRADGDYKAILEGEYNAVQTIVKKETMEKLQRGEATDLVFESDTTKGVRPLGFRIQATTRFRAALKDGHLLFYGGSGESTITHYGLTGTFTYISDTIDLGDSDQGEVIYIGKPVKPKLARSGDPETLPLLN